jgi:hypothetical protein
MLQKKHPIIAALLIIALWGISSYLQSHTTHQQPQANSVQRTAGANNTHTLNETLTYLHDHGTLPEYYLTKAEASKRGWQPSRGNLCDVAPGMMIGGDVFTNAQHLLPSAPHRVWHEADFDYACGNRNADRILYSSDGLIYTTTDHYKTVTPASL